MNDGRLLSILIVFVPVFIIWIGTSLIEKKHSAGKYVSGLGWASLVLLIVWLMYWILTN